MNPPVGPELTAIDLMQRALHGGLTPLHLGGRTLLPIVQGGMGVGVSAHRLAGSVAALGAVGTISSVDLRRHHPDLMERTHDLLPGEAATRRQAGHQRRQPRGAARARSAPRARCPAGAGCWPST